MCPGSPSVFEPASVCASRLPPGPPVSFYRLSRVCPVCVPAHHGVFLHPRCLFTGTVPVCVVVRFVRVIRLPACARVSRVSRVCPGSPRCLFTDSSTRKSNHFSSFRPGKVGTQKQPCGGNHVTTTAPRTVDAGRGIGRRECDDSERDRRGRLDHERT